MLLTTTTRFSLFFTKIVMLNIWFLLGHDTRLSFSLCFCLHWSARAPPRGCLRYTLKTSELESLLPGMVVIWSCYAVDRSRRVHLFRRLCILLPIVSLSFINFNFIFAFLLTIQIWTPACLILKTTNLDILDKSLGTAGMNFMNDEQNNMKRI